MNTVNGTPGTEEYTPPHRVNMPAQLTQIRQNRQDEKLRKLLNASAACVSYPKLWDSEDESLMARAKKVCSGCSVRDLCLVKALKGNESYSVWGGFNENERLKIGYDFPREGDLNEQRAYVKKFIDNPDTVKDISVVNVARTANDKAVHLTRELGDYDDDTDITTEDATLAMSALYAVYYSTLADGLKRQTATEYDFQDYIEKVLAGVIIDNKGPSGCNRWGSFAAKGTGKLDKLKSKIGDETIRQIVRGIIDGD